jgi:hypothetical protein
MVSRLDKLTQKLKRRVKYLDVFNAIFPKVNRAYEILSDTAPNVGVGFVRLVSDEKQGKSVQKSRKALTIFERIIIRGFYRDYRTAIYEEKIRIRLGLNEEFSERIIEENSARLLENALKSTALMVVNSGSE